MDQRVGEPRLLNRSDRAWNRVRIEARLATDPTVQEFPGNAIVTMSKFRFRASRRAGIGDAPIGRSAVILLMAIGPAAANLARAVRGQLVSAEGRLIPLQLIGRAGKTYHLLRLTADYVELLDAPLRKPRPPKEKIVDGTPVASVE